MKHKKEKTRRCHFGVATQVSAALSERLCLQEAVLTAETHNRSRCWEKVTGEDAQSNRASTPTATRLKKHCTREGGKNTDPKDGEDYCKMLSSGAAWLLCYHSQSTKDGVPQHSCTGGGKGLMMTASPWGPADSWWLLGRGVTLFIRGIATVNMTLLQLMCTYAACNPILTMAHKKQATTKTKQRH